MSDSACLTTHAPSGTMCPVSSARVMNWPGSIIPHCGWGQRISASKPTIWPLSSSTIGW